MCGVLPYDPSGFLNLSPIRVAALGKLHQADVVLTGFFPIAGKARCARRAKQAIESEWGPL